MEIEDLLADPASGWISRRWHRCGSRGGGILGPM